MTDLKTVIADLIYQGYINSQPNIHTRTEQHDSLRIPANLNYHTIGGLSHEMVERLERIRPQSFGQARRIPGLTPAALAAVLIHLHKKQAA